MRVPFHVLAPLATAFAGTASLGVASCAGPDLSGDLPGGQEVDPRLAQPGAGQSWHVGPEVSIDATGPARFADPLLAAFKTKRAMDDVRAIDHYYRAPGNEGYDAVIDQELRRLLEAGFVQGDPDARLGVRVEETPLDTPAWTPLSAELDLIEPGASPRVLHAFSTPEGRDRTMLPVNAPSADVEGPIATSLGDLDEGEILVTRATLEQVLARAERKGAAGVVSASLFSFNIDPSGADRHLAAIQYRKAPPGTTLPVMQISPHAYREIELALLRARDRGERVRLHMHAEVRQEAKPLRTLIATVHGSRRPEEAVAVVSHVQEPGACDNASGVAGLAESVVDLAGLLKAGTLEWPERTLLFSWGDEFRQSEVLLDTSPEHVIAGISSDMTGESRDTGAIALLERMPDPGALRPLPPDAHTPWGSSEVSLDQLAPNGLALIARCAMVDVGLRQSTGWQTADHPYEGGSDHDVYIQRGIPAVLFWHFTDFTYHTSIDRLEYVDPAEIRRTQTAILATALAVADAKSTDLGRYLKSLDLERDLRVGAAEAVDDATLAEEWKSWSLGAQRWLRNLCLGIDEPLPIAREPRSDAEHQ